MNHFRPSESPRSPSLDSPNSGLEIAPKRRRVDEIAEEALEKRIKQNDSRR